MHHLSSAASLCGCCGDGPSRLTFDRLKFNTETIAGFHDGTGDNQFAAGLNANLTCRLGRQLHRIPGKVQCAECRSGFRKWEDSEVRCLLHGDSQRDEQSVVERGIMRLVMDPDYD